MDLYKKYSIYQIIKSHYRLVTEILILLIIIVLSLNYYVIDLVSFLDVSSCESKYYEYIPLKQNYNRDELKNNAEQNGYHPEIFGSDVYFHNKGNSDVPKEFKFSNFDGKWHFSIELFGTTGCRMAQRNVKNVVKKINDDMGINEDVSSDINIVNAHYHYSWEPFSNMSL